MSDTSPRDQSALTRNAKQRPARQPKSGERLFEFRKGTDAYACELRDHGEFGVEAQFLLNGELCFALTFQDEPDLSLKGRTLAIVWAEQERKAIEEGEM